VTSDDAATPAPARPVLVALIASPLDPVPPGGGVLDGGVLGERLGGVLGGGALDGGVLDEGLRVGAVLEGWALGVEDVGVG
jgi:hypothetical protein